MKLIYKILFIQQQMRKEFLSEVLQETITSVLEYIAIKEEVVLNSFIHFCNTGKFLDELDS